MGDVIQRFPVRSSSVDRPRRLRLFFDSGSPDSFIKESRCQGFSAMWPLPAPRRFGALGNGVFRAHQVMCLEVRLLGVWCHHMAFVVQDDVLEDEYDLLIGHFFMQNFDIRLDPRRKKAILNRTAIRLAQRIR